MLWEKMMHRRLRSYINKLYFAKNMIYYSLAYLKEEINYKSYQFKGFIWETWKR